MSIRISKIPPIICGIVFLFSSLAKSIDSASFADLLCAYDIPFFGWFAPVIIIAEFVLGVLLILGPYSNKTILFSIIFLLLASVIYAYGILFKNITTCGCFGRFKLFDSPLLTFIRNGILILILIFSYLQTSEYQRIAKSEAICIVLFLSVISFICGLSLNGANILTNKSKPFKSQPWNQSPLSNVIAVDRDSTYLVFAFSYSCPHCLNSIGNLEQYSEFGYVDRIIAIAPVDSIGRQNFTLTYNPTFTIIDLPTKIFEKMISEVPTSFLVQNDSIKKILYGEVITPTLIMESQSQGIE